ncbi:unnamed protein product [Phaedon cochleariae]|uniref:Uncharacterized protein n=1 Tax=Phaedon cochleariae TaxID=80249 RepID=A0A9P0GUP7_PHACE|nr:unnamed protein product [Phaedon cochleariae]
MVEASSSSSSLEESENEISKMNKHKSEMINSILLQNANQKYNQILNTMGLPNRNPIIVKKVQNQSHMSRNKDNTRMKLQRKRQEKVSSSEESSEEDATVNVKKEINQFSDENESIKGLSGSKIEEESATNSDSDSSSANDSIEEEISGTVGKVVASDIQHKKNSKEKKLKKVQPRQSISQDDVSEDDDELIESIEGKILDQNRSSIGFDTSANGRLNIIQDVQVSPAKARSPKEQFKKLYPNIEQLLVELPTKFLDKYDYHLFRIPKNIDPQPMLNMEINIHEENKIVCGDKKFIIKPTAKIPSPGLIVPENKILKFKSNIVMEKYVKSKKHPKLKSVEKQPVSLPNDLKNRHPLFGSNFEDKIELDEDIKRKLDDAISSSLRREKKSKKKKNKVKDQIHNEEVIFNLLNSVGTSSKGKKNIKSEPSDDGAIVSQDSISPIKKSRKTKQSIIDETLMIMKSELLTEYETDTGNISPKKKKHKKNKNMDSSILETPNIKQDISEDIWSTGLSKKEKRRMSVANSTLMMDISRQPKFDPHIGDISTIDMKESTKKHKRKLNGEEGEYRRNKHKKE